TAPHRRLAQAPLAVRSIPSFKEPGVHVVVEAAYDRAITNQWIIPELFGVAMQRTPLVGRCPEPHPGCISTASSSDLLDDHVVVCCSHGAATCREHPSVVH